MFIVTFIVAEGRECRQRFGKRGARAEGNGGRVACVTRRLEMQIAPPGRTIKACL